ncbi:Cytochrome oxidase biogenesis protein Sco1/SenC/PrrC, thiol-disulfide reductase involved in Cu(I) insertion into CoxII Cu(A) center [hydrothermal vent metagenome]|uniref:Cytochrome oxidase biogenesis protein Sco1/SenC/PrrC, thiol-disulfide reductase involved in Cu(I) insertion into CoxII Cu(A) center n=1 Tax=hydrothermal vent metagenome TaxID=652676 RepID=A0A3B0WGF1_9ZZZZ
MLYLKKTFCKKNTVTTLLLCLSLFLPHALLAADKLESTQAKTKVKAHADVQRVKADLSKKPTKRIRKQHSPYGKGYFPNYEFTTEEGKKVKFFDDIIKDKVFSINFIFTNCQNICPLETARLVEVYNQLGDRVGKDIFMYSITVDPERDTPEVLKAYKKKFNIGKGWTFLTGKKEDIDELRVKMGLYIADLDESLPDGQIDHNISLIMGNQKTGQWMKRSPYEASQVLSTMLGDWLFNWKHTDNEVVNSDYKNAAGISTYSDGDYIFRTRCLTCHTIGGGDGIGPDLQGVTAKRDPKWLIRWISKPNEMIKEKDPIIMEMLPKFNNIMMPNLKIHEEDAQKIIDYIKKIEKENIEAAKK